MIGSPPFTHLFYLIVGTVGGPRASTVQVFRMVDALTECGLDSIVFETRSRMSQGRVLSGSRLQRQFALRHRPRIVSVPTAANGRPQWLFSSAAFGHALRLQRKGRFRPLFYCRNPASRETRTARFLKARFPGSVFALEVHELSLVDAYEESVDVYLPISEAVKHELRARGVPSDRVLLARDGADLSRYDEASPQTTADIRTRWGIPMSAFVVAFTGHAYRDRGVDELVVAVSKLKPAVHLLIAGGTDEDLRRLAEVAQHHRCAGRVHFTGHLPPSDVPAVQLGSDVLAIPYTSRLKNARSASPLKLFEYLAAGKPIVSTNLPCLTEVLTDGVNALLVPPDSTAALAATINRLMDEPLLASTLSRNAKEYGNNFSWDARARSIIAFLADGR